MIGIKVTSFLSTISGSLLYSWLLILSGDIFSVGLEAETTLDSKNKSDVSSRVCKRYDVGKDDENSENMETKDA